MSTRYNDGSHYENHQRAAELHDLAAHAYRAAEAIHQTGHAHSRQLLEHSQAAHLQTQLAVNRHGIKTFGHHETAELAYELWTKRGCPQGSPQEDWFCATDELLARAHGAS